MEKFKELKIVTPILKAIEKKGYTDPTDIQVLAIPEILKGKDILASAQTGTGKTAAFAIPILQLLDEKNDDLGKIKVLILTPTRELANQIYENFKEYSRFLKIKTNVIYGGVSQKKQEDFLKKGTDVLIATPGRLLDLVKQEIILLSLVKYLVLDEADQMLDMGFIKDVYRIIKYIPNERQTMLFSATMPKTIEELSTDVLKDPIRIAVTPVTKTLDVITQEVFLVSKNNKLPLLVHLIESKKIKSILVFTRTKHGANKVVKSLLVNNIIAEAIHGNKSQSARERALLNFKSGKTKVLVATDIAARGIDIDKLQFVLNYDLPDTPETYIHRIGRTGRAGKSGVSMSFCDETEVKGLKEIEKHIKKQIKINENHPFYNENINTEKVVSKDKKKTKSSNTTNTLSKKTKNNNKKQYYKKNNRQNKKQA